MLTAGPCIPAAADYSEEAVKAAYVLRFANYVVWPPQAEAQGNFVIAVLDAPGIARQLTSLTQAHRINNRRVEVRPLLSVRDLGDPDILVVGAGHAESLRSWKPTSPSRSTLVVTDEDGALNKGGMLNFLTIDRRVRFEVALKDAEQAHLKISSELLAVAVRVFGVARQSRNLCTLQGIEQPSRDCAIRLAFTGGLECMRWLPEEGFS
jgi:YfiR/HmsC-like